eukprot:gene11241-23372_t
MRAVRATMLLAVAAAGSDPSCLPSASFKYTCVARRDGEQSALQNALSYACGQPATGGCADINPGGKCIVSGDVQDNLLSKASWAMMKQYEAVADPSIPDVQSCDYGGAGAIQPVAGCASKGGTDPTGACSGPLDCYQGTKWCSYCEPTSSKCSYGQ